MIGYNALLVVHILSAMTWVGGGLMLSLVGFRARKNAAAATEFAKLLSFTGLRVMMPAVILVLVTCIWMVVVDSEWSFGQAWVRAALGLFAVAFLDRAVYLSRAAIGMERTVSTMAPSLASSSPC
jgi:hypothetical protein